MKNSLHLEFIIELGCLSVLLDICHPCVNLSFTPSPVDFEIFIEVLRVIDIQKFDIELNLISLRYDIANMTFWMVSKRLWKALGLPQDLSQRLTYLDLRSSTQLISLERRDRKQYPDTQDDARDTAMEADMRPMVGSSTDRLEPTIPVPCNESIATPSADANPEDSVDKRDDDIIADVNDDIKSINIP